MRSTYSCDSNQGSWFGICLSGGTSSSGRVDGCVLERCSVWGKQREVTFLVKSCSSLLAGRHHGATAQSFCLMLGKFWPTKRTDCGYTACVYSMLTPKEVGYSDQFRINKFSSPSNIN